MSERHGRDLGKICTGRKPCAATEDRGDEYDKRKAPAVSKAHNGQWSARGCVSDRARAPHPLFALVPRRSPAFGRSAPASAAPVTRAAAPPARAAALYPGRPDWRIAVACPVRPVRPGGNALPQLGIRLAAGVTLRPPPCHHDGYPAAAHFAGHARLAPGAVVVPLEQVGAGTAGGRPLREAGNGSSGSEEPVADPHADSAPPNTRAGTSAAEPAQERRRGPSDPSHCDAVPSYDPSARPSGAALRGPSRQSTQAAAGSSEPGLATRTTAPTQGPPCPTARGTRNWRSSYPVRTPSTDRRRRRGSSPGAGRSRPGSPVPPPNRGRLPG